MKKNIPSVNKLYRTISKNHLQKNAITTDELWYSRLIGRKISIYFTWVFLHLGLTPNQSTFISFFLGILGLILLSFSNFFVFCLGFIFFHLYIIIDSSDGEMARFLDMKSEMGAFYDKLLHYVMKLGILVVIGIQVYLGTGNMIFLVLGLSTALLSGFSSTFYHLLPKNNTTSYAEQVQNSSFMMGIIRKIFRSLTGDIELSIIMLVLFTFQQLTHFSVAPILGLLLVSQFILLSLYIVQQLVTSAK